MKTGKFATKEGEAASLCAMVLLVGLFLLPFKSLANRLAIATLDCPSTFLSLHTVWTAHSKCKAAVKTDETTATTNSMLIACSDDCWLSMAAIKEGRAM